MKLEPNVKTCFRVCTRLSSKIDAVQIQAKRVISDLLAETSAFDFSPIIGNFLKLFISAVLQRYIIINLFHLTLIVGPLAGFLVPREVPSDFFVNSEMWHYRDFKVIIAEITRFSIESVYQLLVELLVLPRTVVERDGQLDRVE